MIYAESCTTEKAKYIFNNYTLCFIHNQVQIKNTNQL